MGKIIRILLVVLTTSLMLSCSKDEHFDERGEESSQSGATVHTRSVAVPHNKVMILYSAGFHNLSGDQKRNIAELEEGYLPYKLNNDDILLVFARNTKISGRYSLPSSPVLIRLSKDKEGTVLRDTLKTWPEETLAANAGTMKEVLTYIKDSFPAASYGMVFSSHGTGWLPQGYYDSGSSVDVWSALRPHRSIGMDVTDKGAGLVVTEMAVDDMAASIPMHLDYLLFDACLMGCVEVAYAFKDKVSIVGFSPTEVLSEGFDYTKMASLLLGEKCSPVEVCSAYVEKYLAKSGSSRSASISVVQLQYMDELAGVCQTIFEKYRSELSAVKVESETVKSDGYTVKKYTPQNYYTGNHRWFYDLRDILITAGVSEMDMGLFDAALAKVVVYENHTPNFLVNSSFQFHSCCGLSMFLPADNKDEKLAAFYRNLSWNKATGLIE